MKTPGEILLQRHRRAEPKLDAIRHAVLAAKTQPGDESVSMREMLRSLRWHLAGMSVAWLLVLILHSDAGRTPLLTAAMLKPPPPQVMIASLREHRRLLFEMAGSHPVDGDQRQRFVPKPRSERRTEMLLA